MQRKRCFAALVAATCALSLDACATPQNIRDKVKASDDLYKNVLEAHQLLSVAFANEFRLRERQDLNEKVRRSKNEAERQLHLPVWKGLTFAEGVPDVRALLEADDPASRRAVKLLEAFAFPLELSRDMNAPVSRFLQVEVIDLDDVKKLSSKGKDAADEIAKKDGSGSSDSTQAPGSASGGGK